MTLKIVIKFACKCSIASCDKCQRKALKVAAVEPGVKSVALAGAEKDQLVVTGDGVDPFCLAKALRKKFHVAQIIQVEQVKKDGKDKDEKKEELKYPFPWCHVNYPPPYSLCVVYENPYGTNCIIM